MLRDYVMGGLGGDRVNWTVNGAPKNTPSGSPGLSIGEPQNALRKLPKVRAVSFDIYIDTNDVQPKNALGPINVTVFGIIIDVNDAQFKNA